MPNTTLIEAARKAALKTRRGRTITGETIRQRVEETGVFADSPNQWGGIIGSLKNSGVLETTGETTKMLSPAARGRQTPVYTRVGS